MLNMDFMGYFAARKYVLHYSFSQSGVLLQNTLSNKYYVYSDTPFNAASFWAVLIHPEDFSFFLLLFCDLFNVKVNVDVEEIVQ